MITLYKKQYLWWARAYQHIPGLRAYGRFLERHLTKNFWRTHNTLVVISIISAILQIRFYNRLFDRLERDMKKDMLPDPKDWREQIDTDLPI